MKVFRRDLDSITIEEARQLASQEGRAWLAEDLIKPWSVIELVVGSILLLIGFFTDNRTSSGNVEPRIAIGMGFFLLTSVVMKSGFTVLQHMDKVRQVEFSKKLLANDYTGHRKHPRLSLANSLQDPVLPNCNDCNDVDNPRRLPRLSVSNSFQDSASTARNAPDLSKNTTDQQDMLSTASNRFVVSCSNTNVFLHSPTATNQVLDTEASGQSNLILRKPRPPKITEGKPLEFRRSVSG